MSINSYELAADGDRWDETAINQVTEALGRRTNDSLNPIQGPDYVIWLDSAVYYARNGRTGAVTSNAACHSLVNGLMATNKWFHFVGGADYVLTGAINLGSYTSVTITGNPRRGTAFQPADGVNAFELDESWWCTLDGFKIDGVNQTTGGMGIKFTEATGTNYAQRNIFKNIDFSACYQGIGDLNATTNGGSNNTFMDLNFVDCKLTDIDLSLNQTGIWKFERVLLDHVGTPASGDYCMTLSNHHGVIIDGLTMLTGGATSKSAFLMEDSSFIWMSNIDAEKAGQDIFRFENCDIANISNIRAAESGMDAGGADANFTLAGCRDFNISNFFFGTSTGAISYVLDVGADGAVESTRCKFVNGNISSGASHGLFLSDTSTRIQFSNVGFFSNTGDDINESGTPDNNTYKNCSFTSGNGLTFLGGNNIYDVVIQATASLDLSGGATDIDLFYATAPYAIANYRLFYTEASSADAGVTVEIGRYQDGVALDDNYFDQVTSEVSKNLGYAKFYGTTALTQQYVAAGDIVTCGTAGGKTGTGEVRIVMNLVENAS
jgi:hypothetical protein